MLLIDRGTGGRGRPAAGLSCRGPLASMSRSRCPMVASWSPSGTLARSSPKAERDAPEWQAAMKALLLVATRDGPTMLARIGMTQALNRLQQA